MTFSGSSSCHWMKSLCEMSDVWLFTDSHWLELTLPPPARPPSQRVKSTDAYSPTLTRDPQLHHGSAAGGAVLSDHWKRARWCLQKDSPRHRLHLDTSLILAGTPPSAKLWSASPGCVHPTLGLWSHCCKRLKSLPPMPKSYFITSRLFCRPQQSSSSTPWSSYRIERRLRFWNSCPKYLSAKQHFWIWLELDQGEEEARYSKAASPEYVGMLLCLNAPFQILTQSMWIKSFCQIRFPWISLS